MEQLNLQRTRYVPDLQRSSQQQFGMQKQPVQIQKHILSLSEAMEMVRQMKQNNQSVPQIPQHQQFNQQPQFLIHQQPLERMQTPQYYQQNKVNSQTKIVMHPPSYHQNATTQQFHIVQVQAPGKEAQLQLIPVQSVPNQVQFPVKNISNITQLKSPEARIVSHKYFTQNQPKHQHIYPSYYGTPRAPNSYYVPLKLLPCPPLTAIKPPPIVSVSKQSPQVAEPPTSQLQPLQKIPESNAPHFHKQLSNVIDNSPPESILIEEDDINTDISEQLFTEPDPLQEIPDPNATNFHKQLSNVIDNSPPESILIEEDDINTDINEQLITEPDPLQELPEPNATNFQKQLSNVIDNSLPESILIEDVDINTDMNEQIITEPDPSEFMKSFLSFVNSPQEKIKRKRKLKSLQKLLDSNSQNDDDDDYVAKKKPRKNKNKLEEDEANKVVENNNRLMDMIRPCSVQLKKLMLTNEDMPVRIVNDNIVKIRMPRTKVVDTNYKKISNIGFIEYPKGIAYKCLSQTCRFQTYDQELFERHLMNHHSQDATSEWIGYCCTCDDFTTAKTLIDEFDHLLEYHLQTKKVNREKDAKKKEPNSEQLGEEAILAIKEVLDAFEEIVAEVDRAKDYPFADVDNHPFDDVNEKDGLEKCTKTIETKVKNKKHKEKVEKEPSSIAGRMIMKRRKTIDSTRRSSRHSLNDEEKQQLPSVIVNSSNDGKIKMTIKNPARLNSFVFDKQKMKKDKKVAKATFIPDTLTPPESSSNCTDSD